ncbi:metal-dependent hydrolase [Nitratiruptor sp. YY09-18]|uniref:aminofutalosine deaminase family hydrolase n=1 Tax=Nitratiruptor sp. YY09-18 TaxID=2724901 RepID=UPI001916A81A|nr:metal-dependent hydrolase [Nitratiruptor sp. YY09-18]BCD67586.1 aminodeoxyfutalosine deaminase [Nitratiruptor sp. YY09-18]
MQIINPRFVVTPHEVLSHTAVAFEEKIVAIDTLANLTKSYPNAKVIEAKEQALLPTFANPHVHLEFSANQATLSYGEFLPWLYSVIEHREELLPRCDKQCLQNAINALITSGTTTIGQISSYGEEMEICAASKLNIYYFNEIIGSNPAAADVMYASFLDRFFQSKKLESESFKAGVAIHSPYSVHYILAKKALEIAKKHESIVSVHYMESKAEREWIDNANGPFKEFFAKLLNQSRPVNESERFLQLFQETKNLFVHMVWANEKEIELLHNSDTTIIHCPISNRLLGNGVLDLEKIKPLPYTLATDGLSSNYSLNMFEEMRAALFVHAHYHAKEFAKELITKATAFSHEVLGFRGGVIAKGAPATMQLVSVPKDLVREDELFLHIILHTQLPQKVYIKGELYGK